MCNRREETRRTDPAQKPGQQGPADRPTEMYSQDRIAEFILSNSVDVEDYAKARREVEEMGLDPDSIPHARPE